MIEVAEGNQAEAVIPLNAMKRSRGWELLGQVAAMFMTQDQRRVGNSKPSTTDSRVLKKLDTLVAVMENLTRIVADKHLVIGDRQVYEASQRVRKSRQFIKNIERGGF